ncbi:hypothetical protein BHM03_00031862, partial [Ensete ventricosum]
DRHPRDGPRDTLTELPVEDPRGSINPHEVLTPTDVGGLTHSNENRSSRHLSSTPEILDKSPTACRRGRCTPVDYCVCLGTSSVAICQGLGGTVRRSAAASTMTRHLSPAVGGQGVSFACRLLRLPWHTARCQLSGVMGLV